MEGWTQKEKNMYIRERDQHESETEKKQMKKWKWNRIPLGREELDKVSE